MLKNILNVVRARSVGDFVPISEILRRAQAKLEELAKIREVLQVLKLVFLILINNNWITRWRNDYFGCSSRNGKTALALNMAAYAATHTKKLLLYLT